MENVEKSSSIKDQNSTKQNENNTQPNQSDLASQGQALQKLAKNVLLWDLMSYLISNSAVWERNRIVSAPSLFPP